jgi:hypothetical protein
MTDMKFHDYGRMKNRMESVWTKKSLEKSAKDAEDFFTRYRMMLARSVTEIDKIERKGVTTIVYWKDGTVTFVRKEKGVIDQPYIAFCAALAKKLFGSNTKLKREIEKGLERGIAESGNIVKLAYWNGVSRRWINVEAMEYREKNIEKIKAFLGDRLEAVEEGYIAKVLFVRKADKNVEVVVEGNVVCKDTDTGEVWSMMSDDFEMLVERARKGKMHF